MKKYREENWKIQLRHWLTFWVIGETAVNVLELILLDAIKRGAGSMTGPSQDKR